MVVVADLVDGRLVPKGGGSGIIVGGDGSVLTNYHVVQDKENPGQLHDVFVIGRFAERDHAPQLVCAGKPSRAKLQKDLDLALLKCDMDLDGRSWNPQSGPGVWATLPEGRSAEIKVGQKVWVLGYPDVGGGGLTLSTGNVTGWTGIDGAAGKDYIKTDTSVTNGNSGGPVIDDNGRLIGIASAYRTKVDAAGRPVEIPTQGLVRPLSSASDLLAIAAAGWTPREGHTEVELTPGAIDAPVEGGIRLSTKILDAATEKPIAEALVEVLKPGVGYDVNRRDDLVLAWGKSNSAGEVMLRQTVQPGTYTVMVTANGYEPLIGLGSLELKPDTPLSYDPWGTIWLRSR
jgi:V8-like Glu-specific endopeptidase